MRAGKVSFFRSPGCFFFTSHSFPAVHLILFTPPGIICVCSECGFVFQICPRSSTAPLPLEHLNLPLHGPLGRSLSFLLATLWCSALYLALSFLSACDHVLSISLPLFVFALRSEKPLLFSLRHFFRKAPHFSRSPPTPAIYHLDDLSLLFFTHLLSFFLNAGLFCPDPDPSRPNHLPPLPPSSGLCKPYVPIESIQIGPRCDPLSLSVPFEADEWPGIPGFPPCFEDAPLGRLSFSPPIEYPLMISPQGGLNLFCGLSYHNRIIPDGRELMFFPER